MYDGVIRIDICIAFHHFFVPFYMMICRHYRIIIVGMFQGSVRVHPESKDVDTVLVSTLSGSVFALQHITDSDVYGTLADLQSLIAQHPSTK